MLLRVNALPLDADILGALEQWICAVVPHGHGVVRVVLSVELRKPVLGLGCLPLGLSCKVLIPITVQHRIWMRRAINSQDAFRVLSLQDIHSLAVAKDGIPFFSPLLLPCFHLQMLLVPLRRQHQAVVLVHLDEGVIDFGRRGRDLKGAFSRISPGVHDGVRQNGHVHRTRFLHGSNHSGFAHEADRGPDLAVGGHLPDEAVSLRRRLGVLIARVRGLHEGVQAYGGMSSTGGAQGKPPY
mmetsp:Transcript_84668/g.202955  ORF Transcript_84668/g.202955 Transcript_84668/m.202955 type:complete len:240 (-) Transcript_84668:110-829(-)